MHMADVARLVRHIHAIQRVMRFHSYGEGRHSQTLELALRRRRLIRAELLDLQLRLNADVLKVALGQLHRIDEGGAHAIRGMELGFKTLREPSFRQQAPGLWWIVLIVFCPRAELVDAR